MGWCLFDGMKILYCNVEIKTRDGRVIDEHAHEFIVCGVHEEGRDTAYVSSGFFAGVRFSSFRFATFPGPIFFSL